MSSAGDKTKPKLISQKVEASYHVVITCDVEVDFRDPELDVEFPLEGVPLAGEWKLLLKRVGDEGEKVKVFLWFGTLPAGRLGKPAQLTYALFDVAGGVATQERAGAWSKKIGSEGLLRQVAVEGPSRLVGEVAVVCALSFCLTSEDLKQQPFCPPCPWYRFEFTLKQRNPVLGALDETREAAVKRLSDLHLEQLPCQLRLFFPDVGKDGAELWISSDLLGKSAPYFKDLLASDFSEATPRRSKRARKSGAQPLPAPLAADKDFDDSDDETDAFLLEHKPLKLSESTEASELSFREITITQTSFSTYPALLVYFETGYVRFAPLRSASSPSNPSASSTRGDFLTKQFEDDPSLPLPVSPKSMFRLADLLRLPEEDPLSSLCLRAFSGSLTHHGAAFELFSDTSVCFDKIRKVVLEYVVKNWDAVCETASWKEMMERIKRDEVAGAGGVMVELMQDREEAARKKCASFRFVRAFLYSAETDLST